MLVRYDRMHCKFNFNVILMQSCNEKVAVLDVENNQIINLTTSYGMSGCTISSDGQYVCNGGRIFRSSRERWWFIAVSRCERDPTYVRASSG